MGLVERFDAVNRYGKRMFWRAKAAVKKAVKSGGGVKRQIKFQYDPSSYALNFDDGGANAQKFSDDCENITWVYVLWVKS